MQSPIEIIFYDDNDEPTATYSRNRVPAYLLDMAIDLTKSVNSITNVDDERPASEKTAPIFDYVVELFGNKFTRDELKKHSDLFECMAIHQQVLARANTFVRGAVKANPTPPSPKKK